MTQARHEIKKLKNIKQQQKCHWQERIQLYVWLLKEHYLIISYE